MNMVCIGVRPSPVIKSVNIEVRPTAARMKFKKIAAKMINMIIAVVRIVPSMANFSIGMVNVRLAAANPRDAITPRAAPSVGVATPA